MAVLGLSPKPKISSGTVSAAPPMPIRPARGLAPHAPQRARKRAEDDYDQAGGDGLVDIPSRTEDQGRDEDGAPADAEEAREAQDHQL